MKWLSTDRLIFVLEAHTKPWKWRTLLTGKRWALLLVREGQGRTFERKPGE